MPTFVFFSNTTITTTTIRIIINNIIRNIINETRDIKLKAFVSAWSCAIIPNKFITTKTNAKINQTNKTTLKCDKQKAEIKKKIKNKKQNNRKIISRNKKQPTNNYKNNQLHLKQNIYTNPTHRIPLYTHSYIS